MENSEVGDNGFDLKETVKSHRFTMYRNIRVFRDECKTPTEKILKIVGIDMSEYESLIKEFEITEEDPD